MGVGVSFNPLDPDLTLVASTNLSTKQFFFVKLDTNGQVALCGAGERGIGILQDKPSAQGQACRVRIRGGSLLKVAAAIAVNTPLKSDGDGKGVASSTDKDHVIAHTLEASAADGDLIAVDIQRYDLAA